MDKNIIAAFTLSTIAGLSTGIGGIIVVLVKQKGTRFLCLSLGFSAGIMLTVSLADMLPHAAEIFIGSFGRTAGAVATVAAMVIGLGLAALIDQTLPDHSNKKSEGQSSSEKAILFRLGVFSTMAVLIHNFPEGIATFMSTYTNIPLGLSIAIAIALHNVPEGMAVSMPIYYATSSKTKAVAAAFVSGLSEPVGALLAFLVFRPFLTLKLLAVMFSVIAGLMVYIVFDELLPSSWRYGHARLSLMGVLAGILVMTFGLYII